MMNLNLFLREQNAVITEMFNQLKQKIFCLTFIAKDTNMRKKDSFPKFSNDYLENIEMQNNFLMMKIMLESDAKIEHSHHQTPEKRNSFLKFIIKNKLHFTFSNKVADLLGNPVFPDSKELDKESFKVEYKRLKDLLAARSIKVQFKEKITGREKYCFITQELFEYETDQNPDLPMKFTYEFFNRNFKDEIREATEFFMSDFFNKELKAQRDYGIDFYVKPSEISISKEKFLTQIDAVYPLFYEIDESSFHIENIVTDVQLVKSNFAGSGFCEGKLEYEVTYTDGDKRKIRGPFKFYFSLQYLGFLVSYYELAGLNLPADSDASLA